jgi:hypothetical protein
MHIMPISWFSQRSFQGYGCVKFWATISLRVPETKENKEKHEEDDLCKSQNVGKKSIRPLTLRPYLPHPLFVLSDLKGYGCTNLRFTKISFELQGQWKNVQGS